MNDQTLNIDTLRRIVSYNPETGDLSWIFGKMAGKIADKKYKRGYVQLNIMGVTHMGHRLAWMLHHGESPKHYIDHIDGNPSNNKISNLRDVTQEVNSQNRRASNKGNQSGFLGVSWNPQAKKWRARIRFSGQNLCLGFYTDPEEANEIYLKMKRLIHPGSTI